MEQAPPSRRGPGHRLLSSRPCTRSHAMGQHFRVFTPAWVTREMENKQANLTGWQRTEWQGPHRLTADLSWLMLLLKDCLRMRGFIYFLFSLIKGVLCMQQNAGILRGQADCFHVCKPRPHCTDQDPERSQAPHCPSQAPTPPRIATSVGDFCRDRCIRSVPELCVNRLRGLSTPFFWALLLNLDFISPDSTTGEPLGVSGDLLPKQ